MNKIEFNLPTWLQDFYLEIPEVFQDDQQKMALAIALANNNIENQTGGPFGAAIFDMDTNKIISLGVNLVVPQNCAILHAEIVAIMAAQQKLACYSFKSPQKMNIELFTSVEPCAMCMGAINWAGFSRIVCGACDQDAREIGFDEGDKPENWQINLKKRGIDLKTDVLRQEAREVLLKYSQQNGLLYNGHQR